MILAVDIGNTDTKFGVLSGTELVARWALHSDSDRSAEEYADLTRAMLSYFKAGPIESAVIGSVVPILTPIVAAAVTSISQREPLQLQADRIPNIELRVDLPAQVGVDRIANAFGVRELYGPPAIVADFGSTTNFDVVNGDGDLIGVIIAPGMRTSARVLSAAAAQLPEISLERPASLVGTNTVAAMQSGVYWGHVHLVRGVIEQLRDELGSDYRAVATGGLAPVLADDVGVFDAVDPDLTLKGMALIKQALERAA